MNWFKTLFTDTYYVAISPERLLICNLDNGEIFDDVAVIALRATPGNKRIAGFGEAALQLVKLERDLALHYPFQHPRSLFSDFTVAEVMVKHFFTNVVRRRRLPKPMCKVVVHPVQSDSLTQIEQRVAQELMASCGAKEVIVYEGAVLARNNLTKNSLSVLLNQKI